MKKHKEINSFCYTCVNEETSCEIAVILAREKEEMKKVEQEKQEMGEVWELLQIIASCLESDKIADNHVEITLKPTHTAAIH